MQLNVVNDFKVFISGSYYVYHSISVFNKPSYLLVMILTVTEILNQKKQLLN